MSEQFPSTPAEAEAIGFTREDFHCPHCGKKYDILATCDYTVLHNNEELDPIFCDCGHRISFETAVFFYAKVTECEAYHSFVRLP